MSKVLVAVPCMDQVPAQFCQSLATLEKAGPTVVAFQVGSLVYSARNNLAMQAIKQEADYVLWLDSDMVFPSGTLRYLLQELEKHEDDVMMSGIYYRRVAPFSPVAYNKLAIDPEKGATWEELTDVPGEQFELEGVGFGCIMMPTQVFFDVQSKFGTMFDPILGTGEDLAFCWRARQCGWKIIADPKIELGHVGHHVISRSYWEDYRAFQSAQEGK